MKFIKYMLLAFALMFGGQALHAQVGPLPCGGISSFKTFRPEVSYPQGAIVIEWGASYQSQFAANKGNDPCTTPSAWSTNIGTGPTGPAGPQGIPGPAGPGALQTYIMETYLSTADGHQGTDYGYAATNFCTTIGCSTLLTPVELHTTSPGICKVFTSINLPSPIHFDGSSCTFVPQSTMASPYVSLTGCSTTIGSVAVTCSALTGLTAGMAIGGGTLGPENYVFQVTGATTFNLALPASRAFLALLTSGSTATGPINGSIAEAVNGQTVTGPGVPATTTITVVPATNSFTLSNAATIGTTSPVDLALAAGTVISGLTLTAVTETPVIIVPPSSNLNTSQSKPHGPNYGVQLDNVTIQDPSYSHGSFGRSLIGVAGIQVYGQDNVLIRKAAISGLVGSALIQGGITPAVPTGAVRESDTYDVYAYSDGDVNTGQACVAIMTGYGQGTAGQDEINQNGYHNVHCVYPDGEGLTIGTYLHAGTTNGPRLLTFDGDNQFEGGADSTFSFSSTDMVRVLSAGSHNMFLGGEWTTPGFGRSVFHVSQGIDLTLSGLTIGGSGGQAQTFNVSLTHNSTTVGYVSAGSGAGASFMIGPYWNGIGAQLNDGASCTPCNLWLATSSAVNGSGTTLTLNSQYTGSATSGTLLVQGGGSYFHLDQSNALTSPLKLMNGTYVDAGANILSLLGMSSALQNFTVGTGAMLTPPPEQNDYVNGLPSLPGLNMLPQGYTANTQSSVINFQTVWLNSAGKFQTGGVTEYVTPSTGVNPTHSLFYTCAVCDGDFYNNIQNLTSGAGVYQGLNSTGGNNAAFLLVGTTQYWSFGLLANSLFTMNDHTNSKTAFTITPNTEAMAFTGTIASAANTSSTLPLCPNGTAAAYTTTGCVVPNASLASQTANTVMGTTATGTPVDLAVPSCATGLNWATGTGFGCTSFATLATLAGTQTFTGANTFSAGLTVTGGTLGVTGSISSSFKLIGSALILGGSTFAATGCSVSAHAGGATAGTYTSGTSGTCAVTITMGQSVTATVDFSCSVRDTTTPADVQVQTGAVSTTQASFTGTTVSGDVISFACIAH